MPAGVGEPWFDSVEGLLSHALFSLGGVKGIEFGDGFAMAESCGSLCNDAFRMEKKRVVTTTNHNGGINGGITNGMPLIFRCAVKPTPSIARAQETVDFLKKENVTLEISGRHDPAIIRRICPVISSVTALVLCDLLAARYGTDIFLKGKDAL
jgi:chorismate synthase